MGIMDTRFNMGQF